VLPIICYHESTVDTQSMCGETKIWKIEIDAYTHYFVVLLCIDTFPSLEKSGILYTNVWVPMPRFGVLGWIGLSYKTRSEKKAKRLARKISEQKLRAKRKREREALRGMRAHANKTVDHMDIMD